MEIIARRKNSLFIHYAIFALVGGVFLALALVFNKIYFLLGSLVIIAFALWGVIRLLRTPKIIIQCDGECLILREGKFKINQLSRVNYHTTHAEGIHFSWGQLTLLLNRVQIVYNDVADVEYVHNRLMELRLQAEKNSK